MVVPTYKLVGGPYNGNRLEMRGERTLMFKSKNYCGFYRIAKDVKLQSVCTWVSARDYLVTSQALL